MTYTTQQLQAMTNFEIGQALAIKCGKVIADEQYFHYGDRDENVVLLSPAGESFNINNPNDIMPLAFERKIGGHYGKATPDLYFAVSRDKKYISVHTSPLRAIACLILMMED